MTTTIDQKSYLQKYLGGSSITKKKKKKKVMKGKGFNIIDDDVDLSKLRSLEGHELDIFDAGEDGPQIAGIIDDRPEEIKKLEQFQTSSKWKVVNQDDGFNSKLEIEEIKKDIKEEQKENEIVFGKMYSDSEDDNGKDSDQSPPRKPTKTDKSTSVKERTNKTRDNSDSDVSPPRKGRSRESPVKMDKSRKKDSGSDMSPPRKSNSSKEKDRSRKKTRWGDSEEPKSKRNEVSPENLRHKKESSHRKRKSKTPDSDLSPPRKSHRDNQPSSSKNTGGRKISPDDNRHLYQKRNQLPERGYDRQKSDKYNSDIIKSNDRNNIGSKSYKKSSGRGKSDDSDLSPPRKNRKRSESPKRKSSKRDRSSDSDLSPPRRVPNISNTRNQRNDDSPPPTNKKMERTLEGKIAGLQNAKGLRAENEAFRKRENDAFSKMTDEVSGRNAQVVSRKGSKRETSEERRKQKDKAERQKELDEKYKKWSKGIKQIEAQESRMQDFLHEASKPVARHRDDRDLENSLKQVEREGDPMLRYIREKKRERGELGPEKPTYKGNFPPNRFNLRPGYRWDGVDRSNGYEKKYFENQSKRKAQEEEAYKWSTEDL